MVCMRRGQQCHRAPSAFQLVSFIGVPDGRPRFVCAVCSCRVTARRVFGWCGLRAERVPVCVGEAVRCSLEIRRALVWVLPLSAAVLARPCCVRPRTPSPGGRGGSGISILAAPSALYSRPPVSPYPCGSLDAYGIRYIGMYTLLVYQGQSTWRDRTRECVAILSALVWWEWRGAGK